MDSDPSPLSSPSQKPSSICLAEDVLGADDVEHPIKIWEFLVGAVSDDPTRFSCTSRILLYTGGRKRALLVLVLGLLLLGLADMAGEAPLLRGLPTGVTSTSTATTISSNSTTTKSTTNSIGQCKSLQGRRFHKVIRRAVQLQAQAQATPGGNNTTNNTSNGIQMHIHLIPERPPEPPFTIQCNIFHLLWGYASPFRESLEKGIIRGLTDVDKSVTSINVTITIALYECQGYLEKMLQAFPLPVVGPNHNIHVTIHTQHIPMTSVVDDAQNLEAYLSQHQNQTTNDNCFFIPWQWNSFLGRHDTWKPKRPGTYAALHMQEQWAPAMRDMFLPKQPSMIDNDNTTTTTDNDTCHRERPLALFVERGCTGKPRTAVDLKTGKNAFQHIQSQVEALGYNVQIVEICSNTTQQLEVFSNANVVISSHGAQLTNMIFMKPCTATSSTTATSTSTSQAFFQPAIVEVSFRFAWCYPKQQSPDTSNGSRPALLEQWHHCPKGNRYYTKADFFRLATGLGIRYTEIIPHSYHNLMSPNPIEVEQILVDSSLIVDALRQLIQDPTYDYQKQPTYNRTWEGVEPYSYTDFWRYYWFRIWKILRKHGFVT